MAERLLPPQVAPPDFYVAAIGRSGSTMLCNWLASPPERLVFIEPFFLRSGNSRLLRIQLGEYGLAVTDEEWAEREETPAQRFVRLMAPRLRGRRWALKEVLCAEHHAVLQSFAPPKVLITVRSIDDVALSFFEKHRAQRNLDRFSDDWVVRYCQEESAGIVRYRNLLRQRGIPFRVVRYEDFTRAAAKRNDISEFVGWPGNGDTASHFGSFDRAFEVARHGPGISGELRDRDDRGLEQRLVRLADAIAEQCADYQQEFGYC